MSLPALGPAPRASLGLDFGWRAGGRPSFPDGLAACPVRRGGRGARPGGDKSEEAVRRSSFNTDGSSDSSPMIVPSFIGGRSPSEAAVERGPSSSGNSRAD